MLLKPDCCGRIGFADFELTNNSANIRRMKARLTTVEKAHATPATEQEGTRARLEDCPAENRVPLFYPGKPDGKFHTLIKHSGVIQNRRDPALTSTFDTAVFKRLEEGEDVS